jgi:hypothetical protein
LAKFDPSSESTYEGSINTIVMIPCLRAHVSASLLLEIAEKKSLLSRLTGEELQSFMKEATQGDENVEESSQ